jgi:hypothetical protein
MGMAYHSVNQPTNASWIYCHRLREYQSIMIDQMTNLNIPVELSNCHDIQCRIETISARIHIQLLYNNI